MFVFTHICTQLMHPDCTSSIKPCAHMMRWANALRAFKQCMRMRICRQNPGCIHLSPSTRLDRNNDQAKFSKQSIMNLETSHTMHSTHILFESRHKQQRSYSIVPPQRFLLKGTYSHACSPAQWVHFRWVGGRGRYVLSRLHWHLHFASQISDKRCKLSELYLKA